MRVIEGYDELDAVSRVLAIGAFDGVHLGHQTLIEHAKSLAVAAGVRLCVATFDPLPLEVLRPEIPLRRLSGICRRLSLIGEQEPDEVLVIPFSRAFSTLTAEAFVDDVLASAACAIQVVVGSDFRFGNRASGDVELLRSRGAQRGIDVSALDLIELDGEKISSSRIRALIQNGDVSQAAALLGRAPWLDGFVTRGFARGRELGVPTANLAWPDGRVVPAAGVYAGYATLEPGSERYRAAISVGRNPTFDDVQGTAVESYLIDFEGDCYGRPMRVDFVEHLRPELQFQSIAELVTQIWTDVERARLLPV